MTPEESVALLTYANQLDARIALNESNAGLWSYALEHVDVVQAKWVVRDYYATANPNDNRGVPVILPATVRHRVSAMRVQADAKRSALEPPVKHSTPESYRRSDPERWDRLMAEGRAQRRAGLAAGKESPEPTDRHMNPPNPN